MIDFHGVRLVDPVLPQVLGTYEPEEMTLTLELFEPGDRVVVAGCGMGWLAAWIGQRVGGGNVLGVEPQRHLAELVAQNVAVDSYPLPILCGALTPGGGPGWLRQDKNNWALSRATSYSGGDWATQVAGVDLLSLHGQGYDCLALDVEGEEVTLLTEEVLAGTRKLLIDLHRFAVDTADLEKRIDAAGFTLVGEYDRMPRENATHQAWRRS